MGQLFSSPAADEGNSPVVAIHSENAWNDHWKSHKDSSKLMVIDFSASWCGPCRFIEPAFKAMAAKYTDVVFVKIDVDELSEVAQQWQVQAMPTFVLVKGGSEVGRVVGAKKDELEKKIEQLRA
ncbi:thioredoxin H2-2 [Phoenix dactylifera]|uniref:Phloem sap 13 kDa protein 1 n=1 Tax=Phoenix dactylifera TaxID=42345 RepID=A0A8B7CD53_PHODC|nr:thioredoxin H2-2 [Phoenix dactylifera]